MFVWKTDCNLHHGLLKNFTKALESHSCSYWNMVHQKVSDLWFWFDVNNVNIVESHVSSDQLHYIFTNKNWEAQLRGVYIYVNLCWICICSSQKSTICHIILCVLLSYLQLDSPWSFLHIMGVLPYISFFVKQKKVSHTGLNWHDDFWANYPFMMSAVIYEFSSSFYCACNVPAGTRTQWNRIYEHTSYVKHPPKKYLLIKEWSEIRFKLMSSN